MIVESLIGMVDSRDARITALERERDEAQRQLAAEKERGYDRGWDKGFYAGSESRDSELHQMLRRAEDAEARCREWNDRALKAESGLADLRSRLDAAEGRVNDFLTALAYHHPKHEECSIEECYLCSMRDCPKLEGLHYDDDGCPVCDFALPADAPKEK